MMSAGALRLSEGQAKNTAQTARLHATRACRDAHPFVASRPRTTIIGVNAAVMWGISLITNVVLSQTRAATAILVKRHASAGSDFLTTMMHLPTTYDVTRTRTTVCLDGSCHNIPMVLW